MHPLFRKNDEWGCILLHCNGSWEPTVCPQFVCGLSRTITTNEDAFSSIRMHKDAFSLCCSELQRVAVCCSALQWMHKNAFSLYGEGPPAPCHTHTPSTVSSRTKQVLIRRRGGQMLISRQVRIGLAYKPTSFSSSSSSFVSPFYAARGTSGWAQIEGSSSDVSTPATSAGCTAAML